MAFDRHDPLQIAGTVTNEVLDEAVHRNVLNILKCYTGFYDLFSEMIQNALDAVEIRSGLESKAGYIPRIWMRIDMKEPSIKIIDNGIGMSENELKFCFSPNVSFKKNLALRGQKGVGATFLAYGYNFIRLQTKKDDARLAAQLRLGRMWAEDSTGKLSRPLLEQLPSFECAELEDESSGTSVEIRLTGSPSEKPRHLDWFGARTASQWLDALRIKTSLGGVYLSTPPFSPRVVVSVRDEQGTETTAASDGPTYYYPHEIPDLKVQDVNDVKAALDALDGDYAQKQKMLTGEYKRLDCLYGLWGTDQILNDNSPFTSTNLRNRLTEDQTTLVQRYGVVLYAAFMSSTKHWDKLNDETLSLRRGQRILRGGLQMACDFMVQGELITIPLTKATGYQNSSHVIVHFKGGNPDLGRKTFQPELMELAELLAVQAVTFLTKFKSLLRADTGAITGSDYELYEWKKEQEKWVDSHPLKLDKLAPNFCFVSEPQQEQDVVSVFHQLVGSGVIKGLEFLSTTVNDRYDGLFRTCYPDSSYKYSKTLCPLGVCPTAEFPPHSEPKVFEFKKDLDALVRDFNCETKYIKDINLAICWEASGEYSSLLTLTPFLVGDNGSDRQIFGSTHAAFLLVGSTQPEFEVIILSDLIKYLMDPKGEEARQRAIYCT